MKIEETLVEDSNKQKEKVAEKDKQKVKLVERSDKSVNDQSQTKTVDSESDIKG